MIVTCPSCAARYRLNDSKVTGRGAKITCPTCAHIFVVYPEQEQSSQVEVSQVGGSAATLSSGSSAVVQRPIGGAATPVVPPEKAGRNQRSAEALDFRKVGINAWKVKVKIGLTYDFADIKTLRKFIQDGRVTGEDKISHDGRTWVTIGDIPDLDAYFIDVYEKAEAELEASRSGGGGGFEDDDAPTMIVGMSTLSNDLAADALRQATSSTDGLSSDPPSPMTPSGGGQFVDPFAALKSKQRERIQQRRSATNAAPPTKPEEEGKSRAPIIVVILLLAAVGGGWWYTQGQGSGVVEPGPGPVVQPKDPEVTDPGTQPENTGAADDLRRMVEETLQEGENVAPPIDEEPVLIPLGPRGNDGRTTNNGGSTGGAESGGVSVASTDHAANCRQFAQNRDWSQASMACSEALKTRPGDATLLTNHGVALYETGQRDAAAGKLRQAERQGVPTAKKYLGHIARDNGDVAGAVGHYKAYLATNPSDSGTIQAEIDRLTGS